MIIRKVFFIFSFLLLIYLLLPGPTSINNFPPLPNSTKSTLSGDTWQVPNVAAYFSNYYREFVIPFYRDHYRQNTWLFLPPLRLNYPPEFAFTAIKDQTQSTYLEELVYPLRDSLFVNGFEPFYQDGRPKYWGAIRFNLEEKILETKATLRFYPSPLWARLIVWVGIVISVSLLWKLGRRIILYG